MKIEFIFVYMYTLGIFLTRASTITAHFIPHIFYPLHFHNIVINHPKEKENFCFACIKYEEIAVGSTLLISTFVRHLIPNRNSH